jgi:3-oxoadipate enol-lactonase
LRAAGSFADLEGGVRIHYRIQGPPEAPWMVLFNGLLSDTTLWAGTLHGLNQAFRVLTFDFRGQGRSDAPLEGPYTVPVNAQDALGLLEHLGIQRPWLAGLSNGSNVILELLTRHPGCFPGAVLTSAMDHTDFTMRLRLEHWIHCLDLGGAALQFDAVAPYLWGDRFLEARYAVLKAYHEAKETPGKPFHGFRHQIDGVLSWDIRSRLPLVQDPVLCLAGAEDLMTPPWKGKDVAQRIPGSRFEIIPGIGHAFPVEDPKGYVEKVLSFAFPS